MKPLSGSLGTILIGYWLATTSLWAALEPVRLRCEYLENPLAVESPQPCLSWILESPERAQRQTAYRILVAADSQALAADRGDLWDTGQVPSAAQLQIAYGGRPLASGQRAFWKVRVWDAEGRPSDSRESAFWQAGLRSSPDWQAHWIAHPTARPPAWPARNGFHSALTNTADATQWVALDLGETRRFDGFRLFPARPFDWPSDTPGFLFPLRFRFEVSDNADFSAARTVVDLTRQDVVSPGTNAMTCRLTLPTQTRFVRLVVTRLRERDGDQHAFALAEWQVLEGPELASRGATVTAASTIENATWSKAFLVDGDTTSHAGTRPEAAPATWLRKDFTVTTPVRRAVLWASALGAYQLRLNGRAVGDAVLPPEWTDYHQRLQYQAYDVTTLVQTGPNTIAATLGDAWYAGRLGMSDGLVGVLRRVYGTKPWLLARLDIEQGDGGRVAIVTDPTWLATTDGPIRSSDLLDGEVYDARREMRGWDAPGFDASGWSSAEARVMEAFPARLVPQPNEPIRVIEELQPVALTEPRPGVFVLDLGQNIAGRCRVRLRGPAGTTVTLRHAEMINDDGTIYVANLRGAPQVDRYTLRGGEGGETFEPAFTQHGFRYVELTGLASPPARDALTGVVFNSAAPEVGAFECSDPMLSQLWRNIRWTQRANLMSAPTDCPQRDERLGWMGDIQAFAQTAIFNLDMAGFFTKWVPDVRDAQARDGRFPDFAPHPYGPDFRFSGAPAWADAGVIVPWRCYVNYADRRLLEAHFEAAVRWIEFVRRANPDLIWRKERSNDYNDWLNGDWVRKDGWPTRGGSVPNEVFATAFFAHSTDLVARMARVLEREAEAEKYGKLFEAIRAAFQQAFVGPDGQIQGDTQAGYALALHFDLVPAHLRLEAGRHLAEGIARYGGHLSTGIQSTHRALLELSELGHHELAWQLVTNRTFPSWGYMIENGATTIWERWDGYVKGRGFQDAGMNSFNHWAFGAVGEWMVRHILGFQPDERFPGWERFRIRPRPGGGVTWARGRYDSPRGRIASDWRLEGGEFVLAVTVPPNTRAEVFLPADDVAQVQESGLAVEQAPGVRWLRSNAGETVLEVASGSYRFSVAKRIGIKQPGTRAADASTVPRNATWPQAVQAARATWRKVTASESDKTALPASCWRRVQDDFPMECDWALQDGGLEMAPRLDAEAGTDRERGLIARALENVPNASPGGREFAALCAEAPGPEDSRWLDLYVAVCMQRRAARLETVRAKAPRIVFTKRRTIRPSFFAYTEGQSDAQNERHFLPGAELCLLELDGIEGKVRTLRSDPGGVIRDPAVSWDAERVVFAWKKSLDEDDYHLYELDARTEQVRQITSGLGFADYEPAYLPNGDLIFASTRCVQTVDCWWTEVSNLYTCDPDGRYLRRLTFDQVHTVYPQVLDDGRVIYTRWDYNDRGQVFPQPLFQMHPDGTGQAEFYGNNSWFPTTIAHARGIPGTERVLAILCGHHTSQAGKLAIIDPALGRQENQGVQLVAPVRPTPAERIDGYGQEGELWQYPFPLNEREFLVTYAPQGWAGPGERLDGDANFGIYWMDLDGQREWLASDPRLPCQQPVPLVPRSRPPRRASLVDYTKHAGTYYLQDVHAGTGLAGVPRGIVAKLRVIALEFRPAGVGNNGSAGPGGGALISTPVAIGNGTWDVKVVLGETPVRSDGSAFFNVPARTPVYFQAIDGNGYAVQTMRSWSTLQPGEAQSCVGCHEHRNSAPPTDTYRGTLALASGPRDLDPFYGPPRGFSFTREIQPILDRHCIRCHDQRNLRPAETRLARAVVREEDPDWEVALPQPADACNASPVTAVGASTSAEVLTKPAFSLLGAAVSDRLAKRRWSEAYLNLTLAHPADNDWDRGAYVGVFDGEMVNWIGSQSIPAPLPPYAAGAARSALFPLLARGHYNVRLSREERDKLACWIDLLVPYCGDYREAADWADPERETFERYAAKRRRMEIIERQNIQAWIGRPGRPL